MEHVGAIISLVVIIITARLLLKKYNPHAVLLIAGLVMLATGLFLGRNLPVLASPTGLSGFDLFTYIKESFSQTNAGVGLMIMAIGGFVAYIDKIGASKTLVYVAMKPLALFKRQPYIAASLVIPIGQILFVAIPSAAGLSLLLMASLFPILTKLGVSKLSAASVITGTTAFGMGPASAITVSASSIIKMDVINYFVNEQIKLIIPLSITLMLTYYFVNLYYDKKNNFISTNTESKDQDDKPSTPLVYAVIPVLPIVLLLVFSDLFSLFKTPIKLDTTTAMLISLFVAMVFELFRTKSIKQVLDSMKIFWDGMGNIFKTVVTLIIAADIFASGLISLGFIDGLIVLSQSAGFNAVGISVVMTVMIFLASMFMGSGNASFFAFGPLVPKIATKLGVDTTSMILPMQFSASMGRTVSPVAGVIIAVADIAGVSTFQIVKRNLIPLVVALVVMLVFHFIF